VSYHMGRGFGDAIVANPVCTGWSLYLDPACWGMSIAGGLDTSDASAYQGLTQPPQPLPPPAPVPTADNPNPLILPPASGQSAQATVDATIAAGVAANQAMYQNFFSKVPTSCQSTIFPTFGICDLTVYWAVGIVGILGFVYMAGGRR
jgi:hypothetical protein